MENPCAPLLLPLQQHTAYTDALRRAGRNVLSVPLDGAAEAQIITRLIAGCMPVALVSRGPVWTGAPCPKTLRSLRRSLPRGTILILNPDAPMDAALRRAGMVPLITPAHVAEWDISRPISALRAAMHQKWRNRLTRAEATRLKITQTAMPADPAHWLLRRDAAQQRNRRYRALPGWLTCAFAMQNPRDAVLFTARGQGEEIAAMLFLRHGPVVTYHIGWSGDEGRKTHAHQRILWQAAQHFAAHGVQRMDLGTVDTQLAPGLARFKIGTGATIRPLGGTWAALPGLSAALRQFSIHVPSGQKA